MSDTCDVCGKSLMIDGTRYSGIDLTLGIDVKSESPEWREAAQALLGPYELGRRYSVCWECWLRSLGVPPDA